MSATSIAALARSYRAERTATTIVGVLAVVVGAGVAVVGSGWLGTYRAERSLIDPIAVDWLAAHQLGARIVAILIGLLFVVLGLLWFIRALRPETHPDLTLDATVGSGLTITAGAIADAVRVDAERIDGVSKAKATMVGNRERPALRLSVWLREGRDVKAVWQELDEKVLGRARESLGVATLPTAVRLELAAAQRQRVH
jgi:hypothetical protein